MPNAVINRLPDEELARLSRELVRRWKRGLCTYWQGRKLRELGYDPTEMSFEDATRIITAHKKGVAEAVA